MGKQLAMINMAQAVQQHGDTPTKQLYAKAQKRLRSEIRAAGLDVILKNLRSGPGRPYVFAGAVRDALLSVVERKRIVPKDFDIGIDGLTKAEFDKIGSQLKGQPNRYGGYRIRLRSGNVADIWRLEETIGIRLSHRSSSIENVLRSFVLDINAAAFDPRSNKLLDFGAASSIKKRTIGLLPNALLHSQASFAARAVLLSLRLSFAMSEQLQRFVDSYFDRRAFKYELNKSSPSGKWTSQRAVLNMAELEKASPARLLGLVRASSAGPTKSRMSSPSASH